MEKRTLWFASGLLAAIFLAVLATQPAEAESAGSRTSSIVLERDGIRFRTVIHRLSDGNQRGTVILLHGFPGGSVGTTGIVSRQQLVASLTSAGFGAVEPNARAIRFYESSGFAIELDPAKEFELGGAETTEVKLIARIAGASA